MSKPSKPEVVALFITAYAQFTAKARKRMDVWDNYQVVAMDDIPIDTSWSARQLAGTIHDKMREMSERYKTTRLTVELYNDHARVMCRSYEKIGVEANHTAVAVPQGSDPADALGRLSLA